MSDQNCTQCKGTGTLTLLGLEPHPCYSCHGKGVFPAVDVDAIVGVLFSRSGKFRKSAPRVDRWGTAEGARAYYVWRLARFHGGADVCMPVTADMVVRGDPCKQELDAFAEAVARRVFGTDMAAAYRWGHALGAVNQIPDGQPASAYPGGPVADEHKPSWEEPELR